MRVAGVHFLQTDDETYHLGMCSGILRIMRVRFLSLVLLLSAPLPFAAAQTAPEPAQPGPVKNFMRDFGADQKAIWTSPFRMNRKQLLTHALPLAVGTGALIAADRSIERELPNSPTQIRWGNRVSRVGAAYTLSAMVGIPLLAGAHDRRSTSASVGRAGALALADAMVVSTVLKYSLGRERPDTPGGNGRFFQGGNSFPSGHAMTSWAVGMAIVNNRRAPKWLKITAFAAATAISCARVAANRHWASDVFAGGMMGAMIGTHAVRGNP